MTIASVSPVERNRGVILVAQEFKIGHWSLVTGHWSLVIGDWSLVRVTIRSHVFWGQRPVLETFGRAGRAGSETHAQRSGSRHCTHGHDARATLSLMPC